MKAILTIETAKGYLCEASITGRHVQDILNKVLPTLDKMPEEIDGVCMLDWTNTTLVITRLE